MEKMWLCHLRCVDFAILPTHRFSMRAPLLDCRTVYMEALQLHDATEGSWLGKHASPGT